MFKESDVCKLYTHTHIDTYAHIQIFIKFVFHYLICILYVPVENDPKYDSIKMYGSWTS